MRWVLFVLILAASVAHAKQLVVAFGQDKPPFVIGKTRTGLEVEIFRAALSASDYRMVIVHMPNNRLHRAVQNMPNIDAVASVSKTVESKNFVEKFIYFHNYAISKKQDGVVLNQIPDLRNYSVVAWQEAYLVLGNLFRQHFHPQKNKHFNNYYRELASQKSQNAMFWLGRAQVILVDKTIFRWYREQLSISMDTGDEVVYHDLFPGKTWYGAEFRHPEDKQVFEKGLESIKSSGLYDLLYQTSTQLDAEDSQELNNKLTDTTP
ncbi:hypothetical protein HMF8227_00701 [Saliniradius amylolyticus]|uniref:Uncharacterized protein n=1 Tax=Saliniradius amylolyticus TaxID=2183582 RepID=A0A2S2E2F6_9ALTE|nr:transporter substrate-binding domain-containing protein [Saliniradius amylolyticus]AWL11197.1 hypothetical protein HMF8227_00701 [Saliniradius amylolyticus]